MKTRQQPPGAWFKTNGTKVWIDLDALARGSVKLERDALGDQCEGCGGTAFTVSKDRKRVLCAGDDYEGHERPGCGAEFEIEHEDGSDS